MQQKEGDEQLSEGCEDNPSKSNDSGKVDDATTLPASLAKSALEKEKRPKIEARKNRRHSLSNVSSSMKLKASRKSPGRLQRSPSDESLPRRPTEGPPPSSSSSSSLKRRSERSPDVSNGEHPKTIRAGEMSDVSSVPSATIKADLMTDLDEWTEHLRPTKVDTSHVAEEEEAIVQVSSGLYHFALRTAEGGVYTWGKNIEKQLGNDSSRADVQVPTRLESIRRPVVDVQCGADFTLVLVDGGNGSGSGSSDGSGSNNKCGQKRREEGDSGVVVVEETLLAFGNNNMGQCGRETGEKSALMGKWVRLKISKRHIRIPDGSACVSAPTEVVFGRGQGAEEGDDDETGENHHCSRIAPIKSLPGFRRKYFATSRYLEGLHTNTGEKMDAESEGEGKEGNGDRVTVRETKAVTIIEGAFDAMQLSEGGQSVATTPVDEDDESEPDQEDADDHVQAAVVANKSKKRLEKEQHCLPGADSAVSAEFIHYCLYLFYGIYDTDAVAERCAFAEFRIRLRMLQGKFFEAFRIALRELAMAGGDVAEEDQVRQSIVLLEFFTKDENLIPMHEEDLKYFIQEIFVHFIERGWDLAPLEEYFQRQLNLYVIPLAYVLFFDEAKEGFTAMASSSSSSVEDMQGSALEVAATMTTMSGSQGGGNGMKQLRDSVLLKYRTFFNHLECAEQKYRVAGASRIFERVSVVFNALICQRVVEIFERVLVGDVQP